MKKIHQIDKDGNFIREFSSMNEASKVLDILATSISQTCRGIIKQTKGFYFKFKC